MTNSRPVEALRLLQIRQHYDGDLVGSLPLEILLQIVEYLDPGDIVRSQRVSKRWRALFSCETVTLSALHQTLAILGLDNKRVAVEDARTYYRWRHGLQCARPVKKFFLSNSDLCFLRDEPMEERERYSFTYNSGRMCHGKYTFNRFFLHDIRGNFGLLIGGDEFDNVEDRENAIWSFFLSEDYLFLVCEIGHQSRWTVYKTFMEPALERQAGRKFPCNPCMVRIEKNTLAMFGVTLESGFHVCCIYIWDLSADQIYRINNIGVIWLWHMDVDDNRLVTFEMNWRKQPPMVRQTKWTLTGQRLDRKQFPLPLSASFRDRLSEKTRFRRQDDCVSHTFGHKTVTRLVSDQEPNIMLDLIYDYATDKLSLRCVDHDASLKDNSFFNNPCPLLTPYISYQWDNQLGQLHVINTANGSSHMHPYQRDCREITDSGKVLMGNNEVLFLLSVDGIQIWIFNPNFDFDLELGDPFIPMEASG